MEDSDDQLGYLNNLNIPRKSSVSRNERIAMNNNSSPDKVANKL